MLSATRSMAPEKLTMTSPLATPEASTSQNPISQGDPLRWQEELEALLSQLHAQTPAVSTVEAKENSGSIPQPEWEESISALSKALHRIGSILKSRLQPYNPLWYMEILERAQAAGWLLTSHEVEQLIGVKPRYGVGSQTFEWGSWVFEKSGRIGSQIAWKVRKDKEN
jgi:hypothetical protein